MKDSQARTTYLKDYKQPEFYIEKTDLNFDLYEDKAIVTSKVLFSRNKNFEGVFSDSLVLNGKDLVLEQLCLNDVQLTSKEFHQDDENLTIPELTRILADDKEKFTMTCVVTIEPQNNTCLLYTSPSPRDS